MPTDMSEKALESLIVDSLKYRILLQVRTRGPGVHYVLRNKEDIMGTSRP